MLIFWCIYCDFVIQIEIRLLEYMKVYMLNKVYCCILCGYCGNIVCGMRMYGKVYLDNGEEFMDDYMIEIEELLLMLIKLGDYVLLEVGLIDVEVELICLKNEFYKRWCLRKFYEKVEYVFLILRNFFSMCMYCG